MTSLVIQATIPGSSVPSPLLFLVLLVVFIFSLCFQILCLFCHLFAAVADTNSVFKLQLCLLQHMCAGFVISTAYKHLNVW